MCPSLHCAGRQCWNVGSTEINDKVPQVSGFHQGCGRGPTGVPVCSSGSGDRTGQDRMGWDGMELCFPAEGLSVGLWSIARAEKAAPPAEKSKHSLKYSPLPLYKNRDSLNLCPMALPCLGGDASRFPASQLLQPCAASCCPQEGWGLVVGVVGSASLPS